MLLLFSWLIIIIVVGYLLTGQWPVLFKHERIGKDEKSFRMLKFRTLAVDTTQSLQERQFAWGNFLRLTNLDELPQLWNVLKGEMSLVGPRPLPIEYEKLFTEEQRHRHRVLPGITGLAQISGKNSITWDQKFQHDLQYVQQVSFRTDFIILLKTVTLVIALKRDVSLNERRLGT